MGEPVCLVHYHEIGLKGKNRASFENQLVINLKRALAEYKPARIARISGYIVVEPQSVHTFNDMALAIAHVPGVARVTKALKTNLLEDEFKKASIEVLQRVNNFESFKVHARKSSTNYALHTLDINRMVGEVLCEAFPDKKVLMHKPDVIVTVHALQGSAFVYAQSERGVGGLPVGTAGKVVSLLSSGFDSPVATWMVGRRGAVVVPVHFSGRPMTADTSEYLCIDICNKLGPSGMVGRLYVVPFGEHQREISLVVPQSLRVIMYRRIMFKVAEQVANIEGAKALVTGESLGQVASQTLDNMAVVNQAVTLPILRPLVGSDKQEIIARAQEIGTHDISIETAPDCCTLFMPRSPETHARLDQVLEAWDLFDHEAMVQDLINHIEYIDFDSCPAYHAPKAYRHYHDTLLPAY